MPRALHKNRLHCSGFMQWWACSLSSINPKGSRPLRYIVCRGRLRNLGAKSSKIGLYCVTIPGQQKFASYGSKGFCCMWLLKADICGRYCSKTMTADSSKSRSFIRWKKKHCCQRSAFVGVLPQHGAFSLCCRKGKALCERPFALYQFVWSATWKRQIKCQLCPTLQKFLLTFMPVLSVFTYLLCTTLWITILYYWEFPFG